MARRTILVSDLSGDEIPEGKGATVVITFRDARKGMIVLDLTDQEAEKVGAQGRRQAKRGRKPKPRPKVVEGVEVTSGAKPIEGVGTNI